MCVQLLAKPHCDAINARFAGLAPEPFDGRRAHQSLVHRVEGQAVHQASFGNARVEPGLPLLIGTSVGGRSEQPDAGAASRGEQIGVIGLRGAEEPNYASE